jgi:hypothetical protein
MSKNREKCNNLKDTVYDPLPLDNSNADVEDRLAVFAEAISDMRRSFSLHVEAFEMRAKMHKAFYDEFIKVGFTPAQALELVKAKEV